MMSSYSCSAATWQLWRHCGLTTLGLTLSALEAGLLQASVEPFSHVSIFELTPLVSDTSQRAQKRLLPGSPRQLPEAPVSGLSWWIECKLAGQTHASAPC